FASLNGNDEIVKELIKAKAATGIKDYNEGNTALIYAATEGNAQIVKDLIKARADVNAKNYQGKTALSRAISNRNTEVIQILRNAGAK
ncbi:MAG: ankyrin repeat domain-containing protein, partial [Candidatus Paceibacterota bacterium]